MNVTIEPELAAYMRKKGYSNIVVSLAEASTCCSGFSELACGFAGPRAAESLSGKIVRRLPTDEGDVLVTARGLEYDDEVTFGLASFLGLKDISVKGIRPWSL